MAFTIEPTHLDGLLIVKPDVFGDERGFFMEVYRADSFSTIGLPASFIQDNHSRSAKGVLRGMHFQWDPPQGKLVRVTTGRAFLCMVDIRKSSPTLGKYFSREVDAEDRIEIWVPPGFANGFCTLTDKTEIQYKCTSIYNNKSEGSILWNDPELGIPWPLKEPLLSEKDKKGMTLQQWLTTPMSELFKY
jgi:dTDP-4-dehydrorhamnose 3,5-epimerase